MKEDQLKKHKKKPGPKPGSKYRHGGYSFLIRGILPERRRYIAPYLSSVREGLIHDLAKSEEDLSTAQKVLIDRIITFLGCVRLLEEHAREHGLLDSGGCLKSGIGTGHYLSFNRFIKEGLALLGLEKREFEERLLTPAEMARAIETDLAEQARKAENHSTIAQDGRSGDK
jgi:hypothetical protein